MKTECNGFQLEFHGLGRRRVEGEFRPESLVSDGGGVLLREAEVRTGIVSRLSDCFVDYRNPILTEHPLASLLKQRVYGLALGYEDLNDHEALRHDPLLGLLSGRAGRDMVLAGKSTLNRMELTPATASRYSRYKKIVAKPELMDALMVDVFLESYASAPKEIVLDVDATDDPLHGMQEGRFFHGYYRNYCYLPLYIFSGEHLLCARLREANQDGAAGTREELERIIGRIRTRWPEVRIIVRGDSGFCRDDLMTWCENNGVDYVLGLAKNTRLRRMIESEMDIAKARHASSGEAAREFKDMSYRTLNSWSCERRVVGKAEYLSKGENPRFIVTSLSSEEAPARECYEQRYCARGDMENRIKEQQLGLFADRTSCHEMRANQLRLYLSSFAYILVHALRRLGLKGTEMEKAQVTTIRLKLFKIGTRISLSVRRFRLIFSGTYPHADLFRQILNNLLKIPIPA